MLGAALLALDGRCVSGRLVVCPTPIGNLEDVTLRVLSALREADVVACEDTRRTRVLLDRYGVTARLVSYHEHNEQARAAELVERMRDGAVVALVSDAGMPLVSDPGYVLVRACVAAGLPVEVLPGPSAAITALVASGLPADEWQFEGFLPRKKGELRAAVRASRAGRWWRSSRRAGCRRRWRCWPRWIPTREVAVCRELTKAHEEVVRGSAAELAERYADAPPRGEVVLVLGPASAGSGDAGSRSRPAWTRCGAWSTPAPSPRKAAARGGGADGRQRERAVPGADREGVGARRRRRADLP